MVKKKLIVISCLLMLLIQTSIPLLSYATNEEIIEENSEIEIKEDIEENQEELIEDNENKQDIEDIVDDEDTNEETDKDLTIDDEENINNTDQSNTLDTNENEENKTYEETDEELIENEEDEEFDEEFLIALSQQSDIMLLGAGDWYVGNEAEFRNALANGADVIHVRQSIVFSSPIYINYPVRIVDESDDNALGYRVSGQSFITVQNGGSLIIDGMVVHTNTPGTSGMTAINIEPGGSVTFVNSSIVDGGLGNTGILVNSGASLLLWSSHIVNCGTGINLQGSGNLGFAHQDGRQNKFYGNSKAIFIDNFYGTCNFNQGNILMYNNTDSAIYIGNSSGTVNISAGSYYSNNYAVHNCSGTTNISGGDFYSNGWALRVGGNLNLTGGSIHDNSIGVLTDEANSGSFKMSGGNIYSNSTHAIQHQKVNDGECTITGGSISGDIYLQKNDNYVNTNASYPSFTVTPSTYWFKRKLVKTNSNDYANNEISKVTLTPNGAWYKYVENGSQYIILWTGGNVIVRCKDYYGNIIKTSTMNGTIGTAYSVSAPTINGYDLISVPSNANGTYTQNDIIVELKYDLVNVAKVNFEDLLSGVVSAKYWYNASSNSFSGNGTNFSNGTIFENYGYYKVTVVNGVGLEKTITFTLNKNSYTR